MKIGFIGSGDISRFHIDALINNQFEIEAIGTRLNSLRCLQLAESVNLVDKYCSNGWEEVLTKDVDAFCICVDISKTPKILNNVLKIGKPVLVEKPISFHLNDFEDLTKDPMKDNIFVGYNRRYYETVQTLKGFCENSIEGGTVFANIPDTITGYKQFLNTGCHVIDTLRYLLGDFKILKKVVRHRKEQANVFAISALCNNEKWSILINAQNKIPSNFSITINMEDLVYELKPLEKLTIYKGIEVIEPSLKEPIRRYIPKINSSFTELNSFKPGFDNMYKNFGKFVKNNLVDFCDINDARKTAEVCWELIS
tara:strand:- start:106 stop:1038 length:933 start_codon:yes stop_codon:yes gene_type:complete